MIVKNEQAVLARCLESAREIADEIIIVDTGSTDRTHQIARKYTKHVKCFKWIDDFAAARNFSFSHASCDFIMWLDADDVITDENRRKILELKKHLTPDIDMITLRYDLGGEFYSTRERIFNRARNFRWSDAIHEYIAIGGKVIHSDAAVTHKPPADKQSRGRNLRIFERLCANGELTPRQKFYYARELRENGKYAEATTQFTEFLTKNKGWREDNISAVLDLADCYNKLGEPEKSFAALLKSFEYDAPRAQVCCMIGYHYKNKSDIAAAIRWFQTALVLPPETGLGFIQKDFEKFVPAIELAVCYDILGQYEKANGYNEIAGLAKPESPQYIANKNYFSSRLIQ
jgi:glycosyltransferase involved in cell wall biosynthesis